MEFYYGGQAVIEGVMIRGKRYVSLAVRLPNGSITHRLQPLSSFYQSRLRAIPFIRGTLVLIEALVLGIRCLTYSAQVYVGKEEKVSRAAIFSGVIIGVVLGVGIFVVLPFFGSRFVDAYAGAMAGNLVEGLLRIGIFVGYLKLIGLWSEVRRIFAYHGAEHKVVNAYEGGSLDAAEIAKASIAHLRCGTSLVLVVLVMAIFAFSLLGRTPLWLAGRVIFLPIIAALSYEVLRFGAKHKKIGKAVLAPGLWLQSLTTTQPAEGQIEVALVALKGAIIADQRGD